MAETTYKTISESDLKQKIEQHRLWLAKNGGKQLVLIGYDLRNHAQMLRAANLERANLFGAKLERANLREANLLGADLIGANLLGADLIGADLFGADLFGANLEGAKLEGADLRRANLEEAKLEGAKLEGANLFRAFLREATLLEANLEGANLRGADLRGADLLGADLRGADLRGADLREADPEGAKLEGAKLEGAKLEGAKLKGTGLTPEMLSTAAASSEVSRLKEQLEHAKFQALSAEERTEVEKKKSVEEIESLRLQLVTAEEALQGKVAAQVDNAVEKLKAVQQRAEYNIEQTCTWEQLGLGAVFLALLALFLIYLPFIAKAVNYQPLNLEWEYMMLNVVPIVLFIMGNSMLRHANKIRESNARYLHHKHTLDNAMGLLEASVELSELDDELPEMLQLTYQNLQFALLEGNAVDYSMKEKEQGLSDSQMNMLTKLLTEAIKLSGKP